MPPKPATARQRDDLVTVVVGDAPMIYRRKEYPAGTVVTLLKEDAESLMKSGVVKSK